MAENIGTNDRHELTQEEVWARAEGLHEGGVSRNVATTALNDGRLEGMKAPIAATDTTTQSEKPHVSVVDKIKGQYKIALGGMKHDVNLAQEGEDLKNGDKDRLH